MTLSDFIRLTRVNLVRLLLLAVVGGGLGFAYARSLPKVFQADASGFIVATTSNQSTADVTIGNSLAGSKATAFLPLVTSRAVGARAAEIIKSGESPQALVSRVSASVAPDSTILEVVATGSSPQAARDLADAIVVATAAEANRLELGGNAKSGEAALVKIIPVEQALLPSSPIAPNITRYVGGGVVGGLIVGYSYLLIRRLMDTRVRTTKHVEELTGTTALGVVPTSKELKALRMSSPLGLLGVAGESFRQLRTNLRYVSSDGIPRSLVITSASPGEGKSTVSATLARMLAEDGNSVVIIDADLRRPTLATIFEVSGDAGLSEILTGQLDIHEALQPTRDNRLQVLAAGQHAPNPSELLGSSRMRELISELTQKHLVILDAPPLLPVTDAAVLSSEAAGTLLVFAVGRTHKEQAAACAKMISQVGGKLIGTVLNRAPRKGVGAVLYGDGYSAYGEASYAQYQQPGGRRGVRRKGAWRQRRLAKASKG